MTMELDELKQIWKQTPKKNNINTDIMQLIQDRSYGPLAAMKRVFKKQVIVMAIIPLVLLVTNLNDVRIVFTSIMFWSYVAFCIGIILFAYNNYRIVDKMENMNGMVRVHLEQQINLLERRIKLELAGMRGILLFFILLAEVVPYLQHYRMLDLWHSVYPIVRICIYAMLLCLQYFLNRRISQRNLGVHLAHLKRLMSEMQ
jgi:hypothetical protein